MPNSIECIAIDNYPCYHIKTYTFRLNFILPCQGANAMDFNSKVHWDTVYGSKDVTQLGWYEKTPEQCLKLVESCRLHEDDRVLDIGAGASTFIDSLIDSGHKNIIATDISGVALGRLQDRLGPERSQKVTCIVDDITNP